MKILQKKSFAIFVMVVCIVLSLGIGAVKGMIFSPPALVPDTPHATHGVPTHQNDADYRLYDIDTGGYKKWIDDDAKVLSKSVEKELRLYNANWDERYHSLVAVVTVEGVSGDIADYAYEYGREMGLGEGDALLLLDVTGQDAYLATGDDFATMLTDSMATEYMDAYLYDDFMAGDYESGVLALFEALHVLYVDTFG